MAGENDIWAHERRILGPYGDLHRVENILEAGTPDVNYCLRLRNRTHEGWIENKRIARWPPRCGPVNIPHLTLDQVLWAEQRAAAGGRVHMMLRVGREHLLVGPAEMRLVFERTVDADGLIAAAALRSDGFPPVKDLLEALCNV